MKKIIKLIGVVLIIIFVITFINRNNYYEDTTVLSNEAIKEFEKDLKEGKTINPSNYITKKKDYNNKYSIIFMKISKSIEFIVNKSLKKLFNYLEQ